MYITVIQYIVCWFCYWLHPNKSASISLILRQVNASPKEFCEHVRKVLHVLQDEEDYKKLHNTD